MNLKKNIFLSQASFVIFPLMAIMLIAVIFIPAVMAATTAIDGREQKPQVLELRVDAGNHARAFCDGIKALVSITDFFEFYVKNLDGSRKRICSGPWQGSLTENFSGTYTLKGNDPSSGAAYTIVFKQVNSSTLELYMTFKAPNRKCNLGFDIMKLSGDIFKGSSIEASPAAINDASIIPEEPLPVGKHMLLTKKNRVLLKGFLCDLEIKDLAGSANIMAADSRAILWDTTKSIWVGTESNNLSPDGYYSFRYSIRCLPPSQPIATPSEALSGNSANLMKAASIRTAANPWSFYSIPPKEEAKTSGRFQLEPQDVIYGVPTGAAEMVLAREFAKLTSMQLVVKPSETATNGRGIYMERIPKGAADSLPAEGFEIVTTPGKVVIRGADERGCLYGVYALMGRMGNASGSWGIDCGTIRDWPNLPARGICMEQLAPAIRDVDIVKRYLDAFSRARGNVVIFLHNPKQMRAWLKNRDEGRWAKEQMAELADYARSLQMDVWGGMGSGFKTADFPEMDINKASSLYNPFNGDSYAYLFSLYDEILNAYHPTTMLISHDEMMGLSAYAAASGKSTADILAADIVKIHDWLARRKVRTSMWSDMLLDYKVWDKKVGAANSLNPYFNSGATHLALQRLPNDIMIFDWHYGAKSDYASVGYFRRNGFLVAGSPWYDPVAAKSLAASVKKYGGQGIITTDWGFLRTFSPAATTLYAPLCAWSINCVLDHSNNDVTALADTLRDGIYNEGTLAQTTVSFLSASNKSTVDISGGNGIFDIGPFLDLRAFPSGKQVLGGITFDVASGNSGHRNNCIVVTNADDETSEVTFEKSVFQGDAKVQAIAFLHTCFVEEPQYNLRKVGRYVIDYENGTSETIDLQENWNITDVRSSEGLRHNSWSFNRSPEVLVGSKLAWRGSSASSIPLNVQVFIWKNPHPGQKIRSISMSATGAPENSRLALLGLTFLQ
jgi:hypothetical protein